MRSVVMGYFRLVRPANLPTAAADILAGIAIATYMATTDFVAFLSTSFPEIAQLVGASVFLYAGGVVLNDVFDLKIDTVERPERPIPSGLIPVGAAAAFGAILLLLGIGLAFWAGTTSGLVALLLAGAIVLYDALSKKHQFWGPINMGLCRSLNLILGISIVAGTQNWWLSLIPLVYIFAITLISRGEVHGNNKNHIIWAGGMYAAVIFSVVVIVIFKTGSILQAVPFLGLFAFLIYRPLFRAYNSNSPANIKKAVIAGVLSLIVLDAAMAAGFSTWWYGLVLILLLPLSMVLSKLFAVT